MASSEEPQLAISKPGTSLPSASFSFTTPFPVRVGSSTSTKQRRVSLPSSPRLSPAPGWPFRDEMGLEAISTTTAAVTSSDKDKYKRTNNKQELDLTNHFEEDMPMISPFEKKPRKKWTKEETQMLVDGCNKHYPNAKTHLSSKVRSALPDGTSIFEKTRSKKRRPFTPEEDEALKRGYDKHGTLWASILKDPIFHEKNRRSTDLRDRFRNAFPDLYEAAGYKPRNNAKKKKSSEGQAVPVVSSTTMLPDPIPEDMKERIERPRRKRASTAPGLQRFSGRGRKSIPDSTTGSDSETSSAAEERHRCRTRSRQRRSRSRLTPQPERSQPIDFNSAISELRAQAQDLSSSGLSPSITAPSTGSLSTESSLSLNSQNAWPMTCGTTSDPPQVTSWMSSPSRRIISADLFLTSSPPTAINPHTVIGKSAWIPEDWLSANPRLESAHPSSSSGPSPVPSSPFSFAQGVMDRYDLFPYTSASSEFEQDTHSHSAFSEADMFNPATSSYRGFTHHSSEAGDLIFAVGRNGAGGLGMGSGLNVVTHRPLHNIDEIPTGSVRLPEHHRLDTEMSEAQSSSPPDEPPDLDFHIPLVSTPTSEVPMSSISTPAIVKVRQQSNTNGNYRSSSQPPTEPSHSMRTHSLSMFDLPSEHELTDLPFLDMHYYGVGMGMSNAHAALLQDPVVESLDLAGATNSLRNGSNHNDHPASPTHFHSLAQAQLQLSQQDSPFLAHMNAPTPNTNSITSSSTFSPSSGILSPPSLPSKFPMFSPMSARQPYHHSRVQSAVSPTDLLLKDNKRKRVSWDGGAS
ncbi:hypothetical protein Clacol_003548 [Clathrus columnatus]|uniref:Uncharacterized protein n=1 Tax=Clathrus columnatus TaxID=1419009 RepID=A0AAV5A8H9_9AGAM|nr:hypothetical protein Clacol_003548 [Clathrus columnatus]